MSAELNRLQANAQRAVPIVKWGPYLSERQWGTVREDYSESGDAWNYFTHEQSRSRVYRWGEDGIGGISDLQQHLCFALTCWNGKDPILKERLFGLTNTEGNHGEDVKELYYYLDNTPTHSYMEMLYKYPHAAFPYKDLVTTNRRRSKTEREYELLDTGVFNNGNYFDIFITYATNNEEDICIKITTQNHGDNAAPIFILPTLWFRNHWKFEDVQQKPTLKKTLPSQAACCVAANLPNGEQYHFYYQATDLVLMTENETNTQKLFNVPNASPFVKDAFHTALVDGDKDLQYKLAHKQTGTKFSPVYELLIPAKAAATITVRLSKTAINDPFNEDFETVFITRKKEADEFYERLVPAGTSLELAAMQRQAFAGLLWSKQFYKYDVERWIKGDANNMLPPAARKNGRNAIWKHLKIADILSMPDNWEYPWFASWDLCFHCIPLAMVDPVFAKNQLILLCREWFMSPDGQIPAYEWNFGDVNPPIQAWAALRVYNIEKQQTGQGDIIFLKRIFQKLLINFTWWANREDENQNNVFSGGFLGLDNIGVLDRSRLPKGTSIEQVDATAWMGMYAVNLMEIALEIAQTDKSYEDSVTKFYEHFVLIAQTLNESLWDENDQFFYDRLQTANGESIALKVRSIVGLSVLFNAAIIKNAQIQQMPDFKKRMDYVKEYALVNNKILPAEQISDNGDILVSLIPRQKLQQILSIMLNEQEFLSPGGIRALSKYHEQHPFHLQFNNSYYNISYQPGESDNGMFGGNSNWRGPVWLPLNYLLVQTLQHRFEFYGNNLQVAYPTGSNKTFNLQQIATALAAKITGIFLPDETGKRPVHGDANWFYQQPENKHLLLFYEYYHGETAAGIGASHQTGWSSLVAALV